MKLFINSRDELRIIDLNNVVYLEACGNYTTFHFNDQHSRCETATLSSFLTSIKSLYNEKNMPFIRTGRSYIININYIQAINIPKRVIYFDNNEKTSIVLPKKQCAILKDFLFTRFKNASNT